MRFTPSPERFPASLVSAATPLVAASPGPAPPPAGYRALGCCLPGLPSLDAARPWFLSPSRPPSPASPSRPCSPAAPGRAPPRPGRRHRIIRSPTLHLGCALHRHVVLHREIGLDDHDWAGPTRTFPFIPFLLCGFVGASTCFLFVLLMLSGLVRFQRTPIDDEYASAALREPKILLTTTSRKPTSPLTQFVRELKVVFPYSQRMNRGGQVISEIVESCRSHEITDLILVHEHRGQPDGLIVCHLPFGPTSYFGLLNVMTRMIPKKGRPWAKCQKLTPI